MKRRRSVLASAALAAALPTAALAAGAGPVAAPSPLPLAWCLERAEARNPQIEAETAAAAAARQRIPPAGALEDPRFTYQASNVPVDELDFVSTPMSGHQLTLAQKLPPPGLLGSREEAARAAAAAAGASAEDRRRRVAARVEQAWVWLGFAQRALAITERNLELMRQLSRIAAAKYRVGEGLQHDVLRAQVELTRLLDERIRREAALAQREAELARLLDLEPDVALPRTDALEEEAPIPPLKPLVETLEETSPVLAARRARVAEAERMQRVAELEGWPDLDVGLGYRVRRSAASDPVDGSDFLTAGVTIRLPVNRAKWRARVAERGALLRRARAAYRAARADLRDGVRSRLAELRRADAEASLVETGLLPQARQALASSRSAYQVDQVDFPSLIDSQVRLLEAELRLVRARAERRAAFAALEAVVGRTLR